MSLAQCLDQLEVLRVDMDTNVAGPHRQQLQGFTQHMNDLAGIGTQLTLDHLAGDMPDQIDQ
ncbi:hypothetical protein D3C86_2037680 [compost metagenome]